MFAHVVPALRTPRGVEGFDYIIPDDLPIEIGELVLVPFRNRTQVGLVMSVRETSAVADKAQSLLGSYGGLRFPAALIELLNWTAAATFCARPTVFKSFVRSLPRRSPADALKRRQTSLPLGGSLVMRWTVDPLSALIERTRALLHKQQRVLILTPWIASAERFHTLVPNSRLLHSELTPGQAFRAWHAFLTGETTCLIATRLGAWLAPCADHVLINEPEQDDYKQDELAPRYDARRLVRWCTEHVGTRAEGFGITPPLAATDAAPAIDVTCTVNVRHPQGRSAIPMIQSDTLQLLREHPGPRVIIHPIRGVTARFVCRDCSWRATCENCKSEVSETSAGALCRTCGKKSLPPTHCPRCQGADLGKSLPGIEKLKQAWAVHEPDISVTWRDLSAEWIAEPFKDGALVVVTDGALLGGMSEDIRRRERQCLGFRRLADQVRKAHGALIIQSSEELAASWPAWLTSEGVAAFFEQERRERAAFKYPPMIRLVKIIIDGSPEDAERWKQRAEELKLNAAWRGPFSVAHRPHSRQDRFIWHLLWPSETTDENLQTQLAPLASGVIVDLDPIGFFK